MRLLKNNWALIAGLLFWVNAVFAESVKIMDNSSQRAEFSSDLAVCTQQKNENVCTYSGQAYFAQGNTKLWAPTIVVYRNTANKIIKIIAKGDDKGTQGRYHSEPSLEQKKRGDAANSEPLDAQADIISIYPPRNLMVLEGHAQVMRIHDKMLGSYIEYDTNKQTVLTKPAASERTTIIFTIPQTKK